MKPLIRLIFTASFLFIVSAQADEFYWGMSSEVAAVNPPRVGSEMIVGKRTMDHETLVVTDEQTSLSNKGNSHTQVYRFDLKAKTLECLVDGKTTCKGKVSSYKYSDKKLTGINYSYKTEGEDGYEYKGGDQLLEKEFPKLNVNREKGTVFNHGKKYTYMVTYYPLEQAEYDALVQRLFSEKKK